VAGGTGRGARCTETGDHGCPESAIRFTVRNAGGQRAATWKCWSPAGKEDVYVICRDINGALKTSLHQSGRWQVAYFEGFFEESVLEEHRTERGRFIDTWDRPQPIARGVTLALRIMTMRSSVAIDDQSSSPAQMVSVQAPLEGKAIEFDVFLREGTVPPDDWPGRNSMGARLVGAYALPSGNTVQVVWWEIAMPQLGPLQGSPLFYRGRSMDDLRRSANVGILLFADESDCSKAVYDCAAKFRDREPDTRA
jgi:hypothetical protein